MCNDIRRVVELHYGRVGQSSTAASAPRPGLAVVIVGERRDSLRYVQRKAEKAKELGFHSQLVQLPSTCSEEQLLRAIHRLNADDAVHGVLVQLPLPRHIRMSTVLDAISPHKDVDGLHPHSMANLALNGGGAGTFVPWEHMLRTIQQQQRVHHTPHHIPLTHHPHSTHSRGQTAKHRHRPPVSSPPFTSFALLCSSVRRPWQGSDSARKDSDGVVTAELRQRLPPSLSRSSASPAGALMAILTHRALLLLSPTV